MEEEERNIVRQNTYSGLTKAEEGQQNLKNTLINKKSFIGKISNFSPF